LISLTIRKALQTLQKTNKDTWKQKTN